MQITERLDEPAVQLLKIIHRGAGYGHTERWPVWQWVRAQAAKQRLGADEVLAGMPTWQPNYRPVTNAASGGAVVDWAPGSG